MFTQRLWRTAFSSFANCPNANKKHHLNLSIILLGLQPRQLLEALALELICLEYSGTSSGPWSNWLRKKRDEGPPFCCLHFSCSEAKSRLLSWRKVCWWCSEGYAHLALSSILVVRHHGNCSSCSIQSTSVYSVIFSRLPPWVMEEPIIRRYGFYLVYLYLRMNSLNSN